MDYRFEILDKTDLYDGFFRMERYRLRHELFAGGWGKPLLREMLHRDPSVGVLPYDPVLDQVVLLEQFRIGALSLAGGPWVMEIVAGIVEPGESGAGVAFREVREETGARLSDLVRICDMLPSPGGSSESVTLYCGRVDASRVGGFFGVEEEGEDIRAFVCSAEQAFHDVREGRINTAQAIIALQWLELNRSSLRQRWGGEPEEVSDTQFPLF